MYKLIKYIRIMDGILFTLKTIKYNSNTNNIIASNSKRQYKNATNYQINFQQHYKTKNYQPTIRKK